LTLETQKTLENRFTGGFRAFFICAFLSSTFVASSRRESLKSRRGVERKTTSSPAKRLFS